MKRTIHLDTLEGLPGKYLQQMAKLSGVLRNELFIDELLRDDRTVRNIAREIDDYCRKHLIKCYHYTRAVRIEIEKNGLLCRDGDEIRKVFLKNYGHLFSEEEHGRIIQSWEQQFARQKKSRDNRIFFNNTTLALHNRGAKELLSNYGGEQVYFPLMEYPAIQQKLNGMGEPMIVVFRADCSQAEGIGKEFPWGETAISTFHRTLNSEAYTSDVDGYVTTSVPPRDIIEIRKL